MSIPYDFDRSITEKDVSESMDKIRALPRVTPQEPRKGHWTDDGHGHIVCTACNNANVTIWKSNFCPSCGADMREDK